MAGWRYVAIALIAAACGHTYFDPEHDAPTSSDSGPPQANIAFVTSTTQLPTTFGADLSGADMVCMMRAQAAGLSGRFVALLSTTTINARDRLAGSRGWTRKDGKPVLDLPDDMLAGKMYYPISQDENGSSVLAPVITGTTTTGDLNSGNDCGDYSDAGGSLTYGRSSSTSFQWLSYINGSCNAAARIYCFGLGLDAPLAVPPPTGRLAFVTSEAYIVDSGGLNTADTLCNDEAQLAGLSGTFAALLATGSANAMSRFSLTGDNWQRLDGIPIAASTLAFSEGSIDAPLNVSAARTYLNSFGVMTGILNFTQPDSTTLDTCSNWTDVTGSGSCGDPNDVGGLFNNQGGGVACDTQPIYCLQQ